VPRAHPLELDPAQVRAAIVMREPDRQPLRRERARDPVCPLDQERPLAAHQIAEAGPVELVLVADPVQVGVVDRDPAAVGRHDREARARDLPGRHPGAGAGAADELRLPGPELALERHHVAGPEEPAEPLPEPARGRG
jgi:hypothetical protein